MPLLSKGTKNTGTSDSLVKQAMRREVVAKEAKWAFFCSLEMAGIFIFYVKKRIITTKEKLIRNEKNFGT
jgi:hypothetical protein